MKLNNYEIKGVIKVALLFFAFLIGFSSLWFTNSLVKKLGIRSLRIYGTANNLFTWTKYSGYTPEVGSENVLQVGIDRGIYPLSKTLVFGIQCNF